MKKDFLSIIDLSKDEVLHIIALAVRLKKGKKQKLLLSKSLVAIYEKPSLRTRLSFERAMHQLGGATFSYDGRAIGLGVREPINDMAYVIASMADAIALRVNEHSTLVQFAKYAKVPVIN
ncbi:MAG: ornithine carbamoyltransferase, partial [Candidatus Levybacteria bacterium]|nr:ornithine carbamoyltransferase [Candidatus Levybacteria bacterium]